MRSEKGSITVYVLIAMLTFTAFLMTIYVRNSNKEMVQIEIIEKIKAIYENYDIDEVYSTITGATPEILGYDRGIKEITIKTLVENGINVDQNGKEILYYAATIENVAPTETSEVEGTFGVWQTSIDINLTGKENVDIYIWIKNEDGNISIPLDNPIDTSGVQIGVGEYAGLNTKKYVEENLETGETNTAYIPAGFTVSNVEGETSISEGLVIYSGNHEGISDMKTIQETDNQYVWIPVEDSSEIYGTVTEADVELNPDQELIVGEKYGKLYFKTATNSSAHSNWPSEKGYSVTSNREPAYIADETSGDDSKYNVDASGNKIITEEGLKNEFDRMINSVETYKGFYIGRYELTGTVDKPTVVRGAAPLSSNQVYNVNSYLRWYGLYSMCEKLEKGNDKVRTTMIWGCQWDQAIKKAIVETTDSDTGENFLTNPEPYGWYKDSDYTANGGSGTQKGQVSGLKLSAYNIFDMGGNLNDWTLTTFNNTVRVQRGGYFKSSASARSS